MSDNSDNDIVSSFISTLLSKVSFIVTLLSIKFPSRPIFVLSIENL